MIAPRGASAVKGARRFAARCALVPPGRAAPRHLNTFGPPGPDDPAHRRRGACRPRPEAGSPSRCRRGREPTPRGCQPGRGHCGPSTTFAAPRRASRTNRRMLCADRAHFANVRDHRDGRGRLAAMPICHTRRLRSNNPQPAPSGRWRPGPTRRAARQARPGSDTQTRGARDCGVGCGSVGAFAAVGRPRWPVRASRSERGSGQASTAKGQAHSWPRKMLSVAAAQARTPGRETFLTDTARRLVVRDNPGLGGDSCRDMIRRTRGIATDGPRPELRSLVVARSCCAATVPARGCARRACWPARGGSASGALGGAGSSRRRRAGAVIAPDLRQIIAPGPVPRRPTLGHARFVLAARRSPLRCRRSTSRGNDSGSRAFFGGPRPIPIRWRVRAGIAWVLARGAGHG